MVVDTDGVGGERRPFWLVLTPEAGIFGVEHLAPAGSRVRIVADPDRIADLLRGEHPRLALVEGPATEPRSKIEPTPDKPSHLITIRGYGYRFDPVPR